MDRSRWHIVLWLAVLLAAAPSAEAQRAQRASKDPSVGYVYPAGGRQGATIEVSVGGQYLGGASDVFVSGEGARATVVDYSRPPTQKELNDLRNKLEEARKRMQDESKSGKRSVRRGDYRKRFMEIASEMGVDAEDLKALDEYRKQRTDPKRQLNPQLDETVTLRVELAADAEPGQRELRLRTPSGLSNPICFHVGQFPEYDEQEPNDETADAGYQGPLPAIFNGQILPGDVDRFSFEAHKGERLVVAVSARELIPYLADAVPGWFQATLALYDAQGQELAYADDYRFHPDPVLYCEISEDGRYDLEIRDAIYRGRQDFVYRITLGEVPFVTSIFPLGGRSGDQPTIEVKGWNLPTHKLKLAPGDTTPGIHPVSVRKDQRISNRVPFAVDTLPECMEQEPNGEQPSAQQVGLPLIANGRIDRPGDWDVFRFEGRAGDEIVAEVQARRLNSPLDSLLQLTDASGRQLMVNDDHEDEGAGLTTHHADSRLCVTLPADGTYYVGLGDTQHQGGTAYGYRLRISPSRPDFELRVVPSSVNARAGTSVPITVYALRRDGFSEDIAIELKDAPPGFALSGAWVPAGHDRVRLTLTVPSVATEEPFCLRLEGIAVLQGREIRRQAVPAEDMMQAFFYRHLVPAEDFMVMVTGRGRARASLRLVDEDPVKLPAGGTAWVRFFTRSPWLVDQIELELSEPPEGIAIRSVTRVREGAAIVLSAEAGKVEPGLKGNLIVNAFIERTAGAGGSKAAKRRFPLGTLPAIPFEIVAPRAVRSSAFRRRATDSA